MQPRYQDHLTPVSTTLTQSITTSLDVWQALLARLPSIASNCPRFCEMIGPNLIARIKLVINPPTKSPNFSIAEAKETNIEIKMAHLSMKTKNAPQSSARSPLSLTNPWLAQFRPFSLEISQLLPQKYKYT